MWGGFADLAKAAQEATELAAKKAQEAQESINVSLLLNDWKYISYHT